MKRQNSKNSGQVVLIVLLTMIVGLTIALGIFLNSLSDTQITNTQDNSERAFNAADAGIEEALRRNTTDIEGIITAGGLNVPVGSGDLRATVSAQRVDDKLEAFVKQNSTATVQLKGSIPQATSVNIYWTKSGDASTCNSDPKSAALIIELWKSDGTVDYKGYFNHGCTVSSKFVEASSGGSDYKSLVILAVNGVDTLRIRPLFNSTDILVTPVAPGTFPAQQYKITSSANVSGSNESRAIEAVKTVPTLPEIFDYVLFSGSTIIK